jgi:2-haloalkanoic acid dehalogenase type II
VSGPAAGDGYDAGMTNDDRTRTVSSPDAFPTLPPIAAIAFDCYGTLIDYAEDHFIDLMGEVALREELGVDAKTLWERWLHHGKEYWREKGRDNERPTEGPEPEFGSYVDQWTAQFARVFEEYGKRGDARAAHDLLAKQARTSPPYPEVRDVLDALRQRYRLCVLSNADDDWLLTCLDRAGLAFDLIVSSESARSYKPRAPIFLLTAEKLGLRPEQVLYVGDSPFADVQGARNAGMPVAWVNRYGAKLPESIAPPDLEITDLRGLLPLLEA